MRWAWHTERRPVPRAARCHLPGASSAAPSSCAHRRRLRERDQPAGRPTVPGSHVRTGWLAPDAREHVHLWVSHRATLQGLVTPRRPQTNASAPSAFCYGVTIGGLLAATSSRTQSTCRVSAIRTARSSKSATRSCQRSPSTRPSAAHAIRCVVRTRWSARSPWSPASMRTASRPRQTPRTASSSSWERCAAYSVTVCGVCNGM